MEEEQQGAEKGTGMAGAKRCGSGGEEDGGKIGASPGECLCTIRKQQPHRHRHRQRQRLTKMRFTYSVVVIKRARPTPGKSNTVATMAQRYVSGCAFSLVGSDSLETRTKTQHTNRKDKTFTA